MRHKPVTRIGMLIALVAGCGVSLAEDFTPGVQHICIPNAARDGWDCGTIDNPPKPAVAEEAAAVDEPTPAPPAFLADPERPRSAPARIVQQPTEAAAAEVASEPEPATSAQAAAEPIQPEAPAISAEVPTPSTAPMQSEALPDPVTAVAEPLPEPRLSPADSTAPAAAPVETIAERPAIEATPPVSVPEPVVETMPEAVPPPEAATVTEAIESSPVSEMPAPAPVEPMPEPQRATDTEPTATSAPRTIDPLTAPPAQPAVATTPPAPAGGKLYLSSLPGARAFAQLARSQFTLQLAYAASAEGFPNLIQALGIDYRQCYVLRVRRDDGDWWVLAFGSFTDANSAKAALMYIRPAPGMTAVWPRRVGYLQGEYQR